MVSNGEYVVIRQTNKNGSAGIQAEKPNREQKSKPHFGTTVENCMQASFHKNTKKGTNQSRTQLRAVTIAENEYDCIGYGVTDFGVKYTFANIENEIKMSVSWIK